MLHSVNPATAVAEMEHSAAIDVPDAISFFNFILTF